MTVGVGGSAGAKMTTATCPAGKFAISGGFDAQSTVTSSYRTDDGTGWTAVQASGNTGSLTVYVYCL